ncbi:MAG: SDR family NAD(P)-dependent oxidoreductase, partial [Xanthomarina gelatinilytica]|nr:SDR family NAD(P)-dependent oxidoreductase [Xanthomarina gelatinilytica]
MTFENKVIWITGASSGIGKGLALELSKQHCKLILSSRHQEQLFSVKMDCKNQENVQVLAFDLAHYATMSLVVEKAMQLFGHIDILINNAGISQRSPIIDTSIEVDKKLMEIDYLGTVALSKALLPYFIKSKTGHFVVVSSLMGKF